MINRKNRSKNDDRESDNWGDRLIPQKWPYHILFSPNISLPIGPNIYSYYFSF